MRPQSFSAGVLLLLTCQQSNMGQYTTDDGLVCVMTVYRP
jgi:hypothetical protein